MHHLGYISLPAMGQGAADGMLTIVTNLRLTCGLLAHRLPTL